MNSLCLLEPLLSAAPTADTTTTPLLLLLPLLGLLPAGLWLRLPSAHDSSGNKLFLPHTDRMSWTKPRMIKLHFKPLLCGPGFGSSWPSPLQSDD